MNAVVVVYKSNNPMNFFSTVPDSAGQVYIGSSWETSYDLANMGLGTPLTVSFSMTNFKHFAQIDLSEKKIKIVGSETGGHVRRRGATVATLTATDEYGNSESTSVQLAVGVPARFGYPP